VIESPTSSPQLLGYAAYERVLAQDSFRPLPSDAVDNVSRSTQPTICAALPDSQTRGHRFRLSPLSSLIEAWRELLPESAWLDIDYESMVADREATARQIIDFVGLEWDPACGQDEGSKGVITTRVCGKRVSHYQSSVERWRRYGASLVLRDLLEGN